MCRPINLWHSTKRTFDTNTARILLLLWVENDRQILKVKITRRIYVKYNECHTIHKNRVTVLLI